MNLFQVVMPHKLMLLIAFILFFFFEKFWVIISLFQKLIELEVEGENFWLMCHKCSRCRISWRL